MINISLHLTKKSQPYSGMVKPETLNRKSRRMSIQRDKFRISA